MSDMRLAWEPENITPLDLMELRLASYVAGKSGVSLLQNGTMLFVKHDNDIDDVKSAKKVMDEAKFFTDFKVVELKEGGYFVVFHDAVAVYVGDQEFRSMRETIIGRVNELLLPGEHIINAGNYHSDHYLIGIYGRGKLYKDAHNFNFYKRIGA